MKAQFTYVVRINSNWEKETESATLTMFSYGKRGWIWTTDNGKTPGRTNQEGEGLWDGDRQVLGTMRFHLPAKADKAIRKLAKHHARARANTGLGQITEMKISK